MIVVLGEMCWRMAAALGGRVGVVIVVRRRIQKPFLDPRSIPSSYWDGNTHTERERDRGGEGRPFKGTVSYGQGEKSERKGMNE